MAETLKIFKEYSDISYTVRSRATADATYHVQALEKIYHIL